MLLCKYLRVLGIQARVKLIFRYNRSRYRLIARQGAVLSDRTIHARGSVLGFFFRKELRASVAIPEHRLCYCIVMFENTSDRQTCQIIRL